MFIKGDRLKTLRKQKGLTQEELGEMLGVGKSTICCYEKGTRNPSVENLVDLMFIFAISADYLLGADHFIKTVEDDEKVYFMTDEEIKFIEELRKDKLVYDILFEDPKRGARLIKKDIG